MPWPFVLIIGIVIGANLDVLLMAMLALASRRDDADDQAVADVTPRRRVG